MYSETSFNGSAAVGPRLCYLRKTPNFDGYGFNLHAEKGMRGQFIGKVDEGSPAATAGLRRGDRILEVNGHSIAYDSHKQVVARIKERADDAALLVVALAPGDPVPDLVAADKPVRADSPPPPPPPPQLQDPPQLNLKMTATKMHLHPVTEEFDLKKVPMDLKSKFATGLRPTTFVCNVVTVFFLLSFFITYLIFHS